MRKRNIGLLLMSSITVFLIFVLTMFLSLMLTIVLLRMEIIQYPRHEVMLLGFALSSVLIGTLVSLVISRRAMAPILEISAATKEVAKGNFDISLKKRSHALEIDDMARNFLIMVQELSSIETFRSDFISNVSHEFKTPLSAIEGYATLLQNPALSQGKREIYLAKILYNTKRLSGLSGNILQLSRLENQELVLKKTVFSLDEQIRQIILDLEEAWARKNLELDVDLDPVDYTGGSDLLAQVWQNLIGNAIKFTADGGSIRILLRRSQDCVKFYITDNGIGMDEETRKRIFEKFYQGDRSHSTQGNGLGLTLAKRIVDLHGGNITVDSQLGKGSTFTVSLPCGTV